MLAIFAASRCYDIDERFYEGVEKRNEFESLLDDLLAEIHAGNIVIYDEEGNIIEDTANYMDVVTDVYFKGGAEDETIL